MTHPLQRRLIDEVIDREGGYVDHPDDRGGPTNFGITQSVARTAGFQGDMRHLPRCAAFDIYAERYWHSLALDEIATLHDPLAAYLFDYGVNSGPARSAKDFQRLLNVLNRCERDYKDLEPDGVIGRITLGALRSFYRVRGKDGLDVLAHSINGLRIAFLVGLSERRESQEAFSYGWLRRVIQLRDGEA